MDKNDLNPDCPVSATMGVLSGKWKIWILYSLLDGTKRFSDLMRLMPDITQRMLTAQLRELENDKVVVRVVYPVVPPKVEYSLSEIGETLKPLLKHLEEWGSCYIQKRLAVYPH